MLGGGESCGDGGQQPGKGKPESAGPLLDWLPEAFTSFSPAAHQFLLEHLFPRNSTWATLGILHHPKHSFTLEPPIPTLYLAARKTAASPWSHVLKGQKGPSSVPVFQVHRDLVYVK